MNKAQTEELINIAFSAVILIVCISAIANFNFFYDMIGPFVIMLIAFSVIGILVSTFMLYLSLQDFNDARSD